jgi:hypothetical protein
MGERYPHPNAHPKKENKKGPLTEDLSIEQTSKYYCAE